MTSRTRSSSSYSFLFRKKKAQFFILAAFAMVTVMFFISSWIEPFRVLDTSSAVLNEEVYIFNNVHEQIEKVVKTSGSCESMRFDIEELRSTVAKLLSQKNMRMTFTYDASACTDSDIRSSFYLAIQTPTVSVDDSFTVTKN
jgi:hypothetical protein